MPFTPTLKLFLSFIAIQKCKQKMQTIEYLFSERLHAKIKASDQTELMHRLI